MIRHKPQNIKDKCTIRMLFWVMQIHTTVCTTGLSTNEERRTGGVIDHYTTMMSTLSQAVPQQYRLLMYTLRVVPLYSGHPVVQPHIKTSASKI